MADSTTSINLVDDPEPDFSHGSTFTEEEPDFGLGPASTEEEPVLDRSTELETDSLSLRSHARIAYLVAARALHKAIHVAGLGWFAWDGHRFVRDLEDKRITAMIVESIRDLAPEALDDKGLYADLVKAQSSSGLAGVARIMSTLKGIAVSIDDLDADPLLLNVANGVLDLRDLASPDGTPADWRTLVLHPHDPKYLMTHITKAAFDPDASSPVLDMFFDSSLPDLEVREYLQRACGVGLVGEQLAHLLPILQGAGRNGKGVFYGSVHWAMGDYSGVADASLLELTRNPNPNGPTPALVDLRGKRYLWVSETEKAMEIDSARVKKLTGGDPITGRDMYGKSMVTFTPSHLLMLITNHAPQLPADDPAMWARVRRVPWTVVIPEKDRDDDLPVKMHDAADAVLAWALEGLAEYKAHGLAEPSGIRDSTANYQSDQDTVSNFIEERCTYCDATRGDGTKMLHIEYRKYCMGNGVMREHILGERDFGARLDELGFPTTKSNGHRFRAGLKVDDGSVRLPDALSVGDPDRSRNTSPWNAMPGTPTGHLSPSGDPIDADDNHWSMQAPTTSADSTDDHQAPAAAEEVLAEFADAGRPIPPTREEIEETVRQEEADRIAEIQETVADYEAERERFDHSVEYEQAREALGPDVVRNPWGNGIRPAF